MLGSLFTVYETRRAAKYVYLYNAKYICISVPNQTRVFFVETHYIEYMDNFTTGI